MGLTVSLKALMIKFASLRNEMNTKFDFQQLQFAALQKQLDNIIQVLRNYSKKNNDLAELLKNAGML